MMAVLAVPYATQWNWTELDGVGLVHYQHEHPIRDQPGRSLHACMLHVAAGVTYSNKLPMLPESVFQIPTHGC